MTRAAGQEAGPQWAQPIAKAIKKVGPLQSIPSEPFLFNNLSCTSVTYRRVNSQTMQTGCFTRTAFGLVNADDGNTIFNGTDEAIPVVANSNGQVLVPWPNALELVVLDTVSTGGSRLSLYRNPLDKLENQYDSSLHPIKKLKVPPDLAVTDNQGQQLVVNPQALAFSESGSWMVVESMNGAFIRLNLATLEMKAFAPSFATLGGPQSLKSRVAVSSDGRFVAIANNYSGSFKIYDLSSCNPPGNSAYESCSSYDYWPFIAQNVAGLQSIRHISFVNDGLLSLEAVSSQSANTGVYELAPAEKIESLLNYLALGDSYTSGEGAFDYQAGTDTDNNKCHLSVNAYPSLLTADLFGGEGGHSVACSGAVIRDVGSLNDRYKGQVRQGASYEYASVIASFMPGYIAQQRFIGQYQPGIVSVSVGGNDIGFGDILAQCVGLGSCFSSYEDRLEVTHLIDDTVPTLVDLYKQLQLKSPTSRLYVIGYPDVVYPAGDCALNVHLNKDELEFAQQLVHYLNAAISQAADKAGAGYVDITNALVGHRLCETASHNVAVNGLTAGNDAGFLGIDVIGHESYHPNALGHRLIEEYILDRTNNFQAASGSAAKDEESAILNASKTGRKIYKRAPLRGIERTPENVLTIDIDGLAQGLVPNTPYGVHWDGPEAPSLTTIVSDSHGNLKGRISLNGVSRSSGIHSVDVTGTSQTGEAINLTSPVFIKDPPENEPSNITITGISAKATLIIGARRPKKRFSKRAGDQIE